MAGQREAVSFTMDDRAWRRALEANLKGMEVRTEGALARLGLRIQNQARRLCPVDTGRLRASIQTTEVRRDRRGAYVDVGTNVDYAQHVEYGTRHQAPQPYLRPAFLIATGSALEP